MAQYNFGTGSLVLIPPAGSTDISPLPAAILKDVTLDIGFTLKELIGANSFPVDVARGVGKITGKSKHAQVRGGLINSVLGGSTIAAGHTFGKFNVAALVAAGAFVTGAGANFVDDLGVVDNNGVPMTKVTSAPAVGQYSVTVATGTYNFNVAANGSTFFVSYSQNDAVNGKTVSYLNQAMGANVQFALVLFNTFRAKDFGVKLFAVAVPKIMLALKNEDYTEQDLDFTAFTDPATSKVIEFYTSE